MTTKQKADDDKTEEAGNTKKLKMTVENDADNAQKKHYNVLILGASYGSLLGIKLLLAGHHVTLVCRESTATMFEKNGSIVKMPIKGRDDLVEISSKETSNGALFRAISPEKATLEVNTDNNDTTKTTSYELVVLAMQEPQYSAPGVRDLLAAVAKAKLPTMAITNMPLLPYLKRIPGLFDNGDDDSNSKALLDSCFTEASLWEPFDPNLLTQCSPDPQAFRPEASTKPNVLQVRLPTNFKVSKFQSESHTNMLRQMEQDIEQIQFTFGEEVLKLPVKLKAHDSLFVPLAKWAMLMAGNYRCISPFPEKMVSIEHAVCQNVDESRKVYEWVVDLCIQLGGDRADFVPFDKYHKAAQSLKNPSSAARALQDGSTNIERVDKVIAILAKQQGKQYDVIDTIVATVDRWLEENKNKK